MSEVAVIGWERCPWAFEATTYRECKDFPTPSPLRPTPPLLIIQCPKDATELIQLFERACAENKGPQIILVGGEKYSVKQRVEMTNRYPIAAIINTIDLVRVEDLMNAIFLTRRFEEQAQTHQLLRKEEESRQERHYHQLLSELKEQQNQITEIQGRLLQSLQWEKILHDTMLVIMTSVGLGDIELRLEEALRPTLGSVRLRILLHSGTTHPQTLAPPAVAFELHERDLAIGHMVVTPIDGQTFQKKDLKILENISEAIALHIPRFLAFEANANLENEWRTTFDAIADPLILVSEQYQIIDANKAARLRMAETETLHQSPCYKVLFKRESPCAFCRWNQKSNLEISPSQPGEQWEMSSHQLSSKKYKHRIYVHLYKNKFDQIELEKKITAVAQAAEVGVFKASLAHELNNPIGGLLTLVQLQKMGLSKDHPLFPLMSEVENQAFRCRDLIQELLQKARGDMR